MSLAKNHGAFEDILQFANVPWVLIALQHGPRIGIQLGSRLAELLGKPCNGPPAQRQDVFDPPPERGDRKGHDMKAKKKKLPQTTTPHNLLRVAGTSAPESPAAIWPALTDLDRRSHREKASRPPLFPTSQSSVAWRR